ncbi:protein ABHD11 [Galendromus occidentalis]|uniref:sn-1-specific diacylglycerol lipase ABHD11 n=1 Tax=Galendromus occidentalis TaxID=34638 RepID=A0AAJ6QMR8_9ACAR|nr:protein ABHD11 [Galendromus occidentalis]
MVRLLQRIPAALKPSRFLAGEHLPIATCLAIPKRTQSTEDKNDPLSRCKPVNLAYSSFEDTKIETNLSPLVINHGLFGSKSNWKTLAKRFTQKTGTKVFCVDSRNHGDSPQTEEMSIYDMAADLEYFAKQNDFPRCVFLGHSLGGRAVMTLALTKPSLIDRLIVVDISPNSLPNTINGEAKVALLAMEESLARLSPELTTREARLKADAFMELTIKDFGLRQFLLMNLQKGHPDFKYLINLKAIKNNVDKLLRMPDLEGTFEGDVLFIRGGNSGYIKRSDFPIIKKFFPRAQIETIDNAAHWVHADKPNEFVDLVSDFILKKQSP